MKVCTIILYFFCQVFFKTNVSQAEERDPEQTQQSAERHTRFSEGLSANEQEQFEYEPLISFTLPQHVSNLEQMYFHYNISTEASYETLGRQRIIIQKFQEIIKQSPIEKQLNNSEYEIFDSRNITEVLEPQVEKAVAYFLKKIAEIRDKLAYLLPQINEAEKKILRKQYNIHLNDSCTHKDANLLSNTNKRLQNVTSSVSEDISDNLTNSTLYDELKKTADDLKCCLVQLDNKASVASKMRLHLNDTYNFICQSPFFDADMYARDALRKTNDALQSIKNDLQYEPSTQTVLISSNKFDNLILTLEILLMQSNQYINSKLKNIKIFLDNVASESYDVMLERMLTHYFIRMDELYKCKPNAFRKLPGYIDFFQYIWYYDNYYFKYIGKTDIWRRKAINAIYNNLHESIYSSMTLEEIKKIEIEEGHLPRYQALVMVTLKLHSMEIYKHDLEQIMDFLKSIKKTIIIHKDQLANNTYFYALEAGIYTISYQIEKFLMKTHLAFISIKNDYKLYATLSRYSRLHNAINILQFHCDNACKQHNYMKTNTSYTPGTSEHVEALKKILIYLYHSVITTEHVLSNIQTS